MEEGNSETSFENQEIAKLLKSISSKMSFRENNFIRNKAQMFFGINKKMLVIDYYLIFQLYFPKAIFKVKLIHLYIKS